MFNITTTRTVDDVLREEQEAYERKQNTAAMRRLRWACDTDEFYRLFKVVQRMHPKWETKRVLKRVRRLIKYPWVN